MRGTRHDARSDGIFYFDNEPNLLDQYLINKDMATATAVLRALSATGQIIRFPGMTASGVYPIRIPFGGIQKPVNPDGYTDRFAILQVEEARLSVRAYRKPAARAGTISGRQGDRRVGRDSVLATDGPAGQRVFTEAFSQRSRAAR